MKKIVFIVALFLLPAVAKAEETNPTAASVADKALDLAKNAVVNVSEMVKKTAPEVFRIMVKQQIVDGISQILLVSLLLIVGIGYMIVIRKIWKIDHDTCTCSEEDAYIAACTIVPLIYLTMVFIIGACVVTEDICQLINPEYYAIKDMVKIALRK